jgi:hypothetical protein
MCVPPIIGMQNLRSSVSLSICLYDAPSTPPIKDKTSQKDPPSKEYGVGGLLPEECYQLIKMEDFGVGVNCIRESENYYFILSLPQLGPIAAL